MKIIKQGANAFGNATYSFKKMSKRKPIKLYMNGIQKKIHQKKYAFSFEIVYKKYTIQLCEYFNILNEKIKK